MKFDIKRCDFCIYDAPKKHREFCKTCKNYNKFELKVLRTPLEQHLYEKLLEREAWIEEPIEFDRKTALIVLQAISHKMYPSLDIFGNKTLVINRYEFEAIRQKFLDKRSMDMTNDGMVNCNLDACYNENARLKAENFELQKQVNECNRDCEKYAIENGELQKQVDELKNRKIEPLIVQCHAPALENCPKVEQAVKDTAKEIYLWLEEKDKRGMTVPFDMVLRQLKERYGVGVE